MKKLALLSVAALMLAATVFAPVAQAQSLGDVDVRLEPEGSLIVTATIPCYEGEWAGLFVEVTQRQGQNEVSANMASFQPCESTPMTINRKIQGSFRPGPATVYGEIGVCVPDAPCKQEVFEEDIILRPIHP